MARDAAIAAVIGAHLRDARDKAGLSQHNAAEQLGVVQSQVSAWEVGKYLISIPTLLAFADLYRVSPLTLLGREPAPAAEGGA